MQLRLIEFGSADYEQMKDLRVTALLAPIGIPPEYIVPEKEKNDTFIGAFEGPRIIGCCVLTPRDREKMQLRQMAVHPDHQKQKIGAQIINFAEAVAGNMGFSVLMMHARNPVIGFYEKCGYGVDGEEFFEVGMGHHCMQKRLRFDD